MKLATTARGDPYEKYFIKELEKTIVLSAKLKSNDHYKFKQTPKLELDPYKTAHTYNKIMYVVRFQLKKNVKTLLAAGLTHFKKDWEMRLTHLHDETIKKPFPGDEYHRQLFMDSASLEVDSIPLSSYVAGGMRALVV